MHIGGNGFTQDLPETIHFMVTNLQGVLLSRREKKIFPNVLTPASLVRTRRMGNTSRFVNERALIH